MVTGHPNHGLSALLVPVEGRGIHPRVPEARLLVISASLEKALRTGEVPEALVSLVAQVRMAEDDGVVVVPPRGDAGMAEIYRSARAHLYPGHAEDMICWTLLDSQAGPAGSGQAFGRNPRAHPRRPRPASWCPTRLLW